MKNKTIVLLTICFFIPSLLCIKIKATSNDLMGIIPKEYIKKFLPENPIIVEAGAHNGSDTEEMARMWPDGKIETVLPDMIRVVINRAPPPPPDDYGIEKKGI